MHEMKLSQVVVLATGLARRKAVELIKYGSVKVNNEIALEYSRLINCQKDKVEIQDYKFSLPALKEKSSEKHYFIYYKPKGVEVTLKEGLSEHNSQKDNYRNDNSIHKKLNTLQGVISEIGIPNLKPVGRLDLDSEGLLLLSNDGDFINKLTHPKYHVPKIYKVWVNGLKNSSENSQQVKFLNDSFNLLSIESEENDSIVLEIELREGKNRQIRRICAQAGLYVKRILRISIGEVKLNKLKLGEWKVLNNHSIQSLLKKAGL
jgi:23S rRNA pseudouridine2605 synthase